MTTRAAERAWSLPAVWAKRGLALPLAAGLLMALTVRADAEGTILHEYVPPDPKEDVAFAATTLDGDLPAAMQTPSGVATAPDPRKAPDTGRVYSGVTTDDSPDSTYEPDRDTRTPNVENYDDPFSPATSPFKRLRAYDAVDDDYTLRVEHRGLSPIEVGGQVESGDEAFYGDLSVDLLPEQPVRIPTVGPGARVVRMHVNPEVDVVLLRDGADNWFIRGGERQRVRLVTQLAIPRATFGSDFPDVSWEDLAPHVRAQPDAHQEPFQRVAEAIGVSRDLSPRAALEKLVFYFRGFESSDEPPTGAGDIYLDLALSKKGVCRHRAFAFLVTALNLGLPSRMVVNEAHAWVEVYDGALWHRIDLGGAALNLDQEVDPNRPAYRPPPDPFEWPEGAEAGSGQGLAERTREESGAGGGPSGATPSAPSSTDPDASDPTAPSAPSPSYPAEPGRPPTAIDVELDGREVQRGQSVRLRGEVASEGKPCAHLRVDVVLTGGPRPGGVVIGSLSTDAKGRYDGSVVVPRDFSPGDYELSVATPGDAQCASARAD